MVILGFHNDTQIEVMQIFGGPRLLYGSMRDVLTIEIEVKEGNTVDVIKKLFLENIGSGTLYAITDNDKTEIGQGYNILVSVADEYREVVPTPGKREPLTIEEVYIVTLAQSTHQESLLKSNT